MTLSPRDYEALSEEGRRVVQELQLERAGLRLALAGAMVALDAARAAGHWQVVHDVAAEIGKLLEGRA